MQVGFLRRKVNALNVYLLALIYLFLVTLGDANNFTRNNIYFVSKICIPSSFGVSYYKRFIMYLGNKNSSRSCLFHDTPVSLWIVEHIKFPVSNDRFRNWNRHLSHFPVDGITIAEIKFHYVTLTLTGLDVGMMNIYKYNNKYAN